MKRLIPLTFCFIAILTLQASASGIKVIKIKKQTITLFNEIPAFIISKNSVTISSKLMGYVRGLKVDVGNRVKKGEILLKIDSRSIGEKIKQARANFENAKFNYIRIEKLYKEGAVSEKTFIATKSTFEQAKATLKDIKTLLGYSVVRSPINGYISKKFVQNGDIAAPSQPLLVVEGSNFYQVQANIPDSLFGNFLKMKKIPVEIKIKKIYGSPQYVQKSEDPTTHTHLVKIIIPKFKFIHPGEFAKVLITRKPIESITIPENSIVERGGIEGVFVLDKSNVVHFRMLRLGEKIGNRYIVLSGLKQGERIVVNPPYYLENNSRLK